MKVLLCGGGNATHVLASKVAALDGCSSRILTLFGDEAERLRAVVENTKCIVCSADTGECVRGCPEVITNDPAEALPCDVILMAVPSFAHEMYLKAVAPYVQPGTILGAMPGMGGFDMLAREILGDKLDSCMLFALETLPWACRIKEFGTEVEILGTKQTVDMTVAPFDKRDEVVAVLQRIIGPAPKLLPTATFLGVTLMNINSLWHPCIVYGGWRNWDGVSTFEKAPLFYQGCDDWTADKIAAVSEEVVALKKVLLTSYPGVNLDIVRPAPEWMVIAYGADVTDQSSLGAMLRSNKGYHGLVHAMKPADDGKLLPNFQFRYLREDVPMGLIVTRGIAELAGVATPNMDEVLEWAQARLEKEYLKNGSLTGKDIMETRCPQRFGYTDLESFMKGLRYV